MLKWVRGDENDIRGRIRSLRKARGMTQQELADKLHTTKQTIGKYEQGIVTNLPLSRISELAQALFFVLQNA